jgi:hypothetical protein
MPFGLVKSSQLLQEHVAFIFVAKRLFYPDDRSSGHFGAQATSYKTTQHIILEARRQQSSFSLP